MQFLSHSLSAARTLFCGIQRNAIRVAVVSMYGALTMTRGLC